MQIEVEPNIADILRKLQAQAAARQMPLDAYLEQFIDPDPAPSSDTIAIEEFDRILDDLCASPTNAPPLPADFSRADIYAEHD